MPEVLSVIVTACFLLEMVLALIVPAELRRHTRSVGGWLGRRLCWC
jgi:hypothetical protein